MADLENNMMDNSDICDHEEEDEENPECVIGGHLAHTVTAMIRVKTILSSKIPNNQEYNTIVDLINEYVKKHCNHNIVYDTIDITPDYSKTIRFCMECYTDFPHPS